VPLLIETDLHYALDYQPVGVLRLGVDPAGEGSDETIWVVRDTFKAKIVAKERVSNPKSIAQKTITLMTFYGIPQQEVWVDNFGEGANVALEIAAASQEFVNAINVNDEADDKERYINKRAEAFWRLRQWLRSGGDLVKDEHWKQLLTIKYRRELSGKLKIMGKRKMQKLGIKSPDAADALMLTFVTELRLTVKGSQSLKLRGTLTALVRSHKYRDKNKAMRDRDTRNMTTSMQELLSGSLKCNGQDLI